MLTVLRQRAHKKSLGGGWVVDMGVHAHACNQLLDSHARFVKYYARNVALQWGLGARQCVYLQVTGTVAPASYTGKAICNAKSIAVPRPCAGSLPRIPIQSTLAQDPSVPYRTGTPIRLKGSSTKPACSAGECDQQAADTGFKRKLKAVHSITF